MPTAEIAWRKQSDDRLSSSPVFKGAPLRTRRSWSTIAEHLGIWHLHDSSHTANDLQRPPACNAAAGRNGHDVDVLEHGVVTIYHA
jgi:hypothetical protein